MTDAVYTTRRAALMASKYIRGPQITSVEVQRMGFEKYAIFVRWCGYPGNFYQLRLAEGLATCMEA